MNIDLKSPQNIYVNVSCEVDSVLKKFGGSSEDERASETKNHVNVILAIANVMALTP